MNDFSIILEDGPLMAVNKSAGLLTEGPATIERTLVRLVKEDLKRRLHKPGNVYLGVPHRLDRAVSGVILFAKNSKAADRLAVQFRDRQVRKIYWAIVDQPPTPAEGCLVDWLEKVPDQATARVTPAYQPSAREATLHYRTLEQIVGGWLVEIELTTGRFHQIRVQLGHRGWPIRGDVKYGSTTTVPADLPTADEPPIALHARSITILHPVRYDLLTFTAPLPNYWRPLLGQNHPHWENEPSASRR